MNANDWFNLICALLLAACVLVVVGVFLFGDEQR